MSDVTGNFDLHYARLVPKTTRERASDSLKLEGDLAVHASPTSMWPDFMVGQTERPTRVVLVDDDPHIRRVIAQELMNDPRTLLVAQAACVREARRVIRQHVFDVLVVDIRLGDGEGYELLDFVKGVHPSVESIVISVMDCEDQVLRAFELGASGYLCKQSWFGSYTDAVLQVVNGGAYITPNLARRLLQRFSKTDGHAEPRQTHEEMERLSAREKEVLRLVASGHTSMEIGKRLLISVMTVNTHIRNIYRKLQVRTRAQAVRFASLRGLF